MALLKTVPGDIVAIPARKDGLQGFVLSRVIQETKMPTIEVFENPHDLPKERMGSDKLQKR